MRKTIMALIIVLPLLFVLVIFSALNIISLGVNISVSGIELTVEGLDDDNFVDIADHGQIKLTATVSPDNATEKGYTLTADDPTLCTITDDGTFVPLKAGNVTVTATSKDKGFTDSVTITIHSTKPYDFDFKLFGDGDDDLLSSDLSGYSATLPATGLYSYSFASVPGGFAGYTIAARSGSFGEVDKGARTLYLPFSGIHTFDVTVPDGAFGDDLTKTVTLRVRKPASAFETGIYVNGVADGAIVTLATDADEATLYVECPSEPVFESAYATCDGVDNLGNNRYILHIAVNAGGEERFSGTISAQNGKSVGVDFSFLDFDYRVTSEWGLSEQGGQTVGYARLNMDNMFYALPSVGATGVGFEWTIEDGENAELYPADGGKECSFYPTVAGEYTLSVQAFKGEAPLGDKRIVKVTAIQTVQGIQIRNSRAADLAKYPTIAGNEYNLADGQYVKTAVMTELAYVAYPLGSVQQSDITFTSSDDDIAEIVYSEGKVYIKPVGNGQVTVAATWIGNDLFGTAIRDSFTFNCAADAVAVKTAPQLVQAMQTQTAAVLMANIKLGTDENGRVLDEATRKNTLIANRINSTYNVEWYKNSPEVNANDAKVTHALEFTCDVYGNGNYIDADNYTHVMDGTGKVPKFEGVYSGPLKFVKYQQVASVAGQDNCAFLIRNDGVKLYGVQLLGCSDASIFDDETNNYDLNMLNLVGTTLEVNANCDIINCRIRNGRNVVRVYGGNKDGEKYFVDRLDGSSVKDERIKVNIEGCLITQGREFLVKLGANRALRASNALGAEPRLTDPTTGSAYRTKDGSTTSNDYSDLLNDATFYDRYVLTDLTIADSVLETSGLFCIGVESNFAGDYLYEGSNGAYRYATSSWERSGGTSFPAILRLKGDVRMYDWKDLAHVNSDTLIQSEGAFKDWLKLNINDMFDFVSKNYSDRYGNLIYKQNGVNYAHGGIAFYGGGVNYSQIDLSGLNAAYSDLAHVRININILANADRNSSMYTQGTMLPNAAGHNDFNFFLYGNDSPNSYAKQVADKNNQTAYLGIAHLPLY